MTPANPPNQATSSRHFVGWLRGSACGGRHLLAEEEEGQVRVVWHLAERWRGGEVKGWRGGEVERWREWRGGESGEVERWRGGEVERWRGRGREWWGIARRGAAVCWPGGVCAGRAACVLAGRHASRTREEAEKEKPAAQKAVGSGLHGCRSRSRARKRSIPSAPKASSLAARVQRRVARRSCERVAPCASPSYGSGYVVRTGFGEAQRLSMASSSASHPGANLPRRRRSLGRVCAGGRAGVCKSSVRAARACCASRLGGSSPRRGAAAAG